MKSLTFFAVTLLWATSQLVSADEPRVSVASELLSTFQTQAEALTAAVQARDVHAIHEIDHSMSDQTNALKKSLPSLSADRQQTLDALCADLIKQVARAHHDGHHEDWDDAASAQKQFSADVRQIGTFLGSAK